MALLPPTGGYVFGFVSWSVCHSVCMSVYRRQILTTKDGPRAVRVNIPVWKTTLWRHSITTVVYCYYIYRHLWMNGIRWIYGVIIDHLLEIMTTHLNEWMNEIPVLLYSFRRWKIKLAFRYPVNQSSSYFHKMLKPLILSSHLAKFLISNYWQPCQKWEIREFGLYI